MYFIREMSRMYVVEVWKIYFELFCKFRELFILFLNKFVSELWLKVVVIMFKV